MFTGPGVKIPGASGGTREMTLRAPFGPGNN